MAQNYKFTLSYLGTKYHGWQRQLNAVTIQATLEDTLSRLTGEKVHLVGCGRTDAGVHARNYVANGMITTSIPEEKLPLALNVNLPEDIVVHKAEIVPDDFHASFSCVEKEYTFSILNARTRDPFLADRAAYIPAQLDFDKMVEASQHFVGEHDFSSMRTLGSNVKTTVREIYYCELSKEGDLIKMRVAANGFLYNMVRTIAGTLVFVGLGKIKPDEITDILLSCDRKRAGPVMEACGLCMTGVKY